MSAPAFIKNRENVKLYGLTTKLFEIELEYADIANFFVYLSLYMLITIYQLSIL